MAAISVKTLGRFYNSQAPSSLRTYGNHLSSNSRLA